MRHDSSSADALVDVALDLPVDREFTYRAPAAWAGRVSIGHRVHVPFRGRTQVGIVTGHPSEAPGVKLLSVREAPDTAPLLDATLLELGRFMARYYGCAFGEALAAMLPRGVRRRGPGRRRVRARLDPEGYAAYEAELRAAAHGETPPEPATQADAARMRVLRLLRRVPEGLTITEVCRRADVSRSPVQTLAKRGLIVLTEERSQSEALREAVEDKPVEPDVIPTPTDEQAKAIAALHTALEQRSFATLLLHGITGSGKTEVYLRAIARCIEQERQAIVLVPEIALTPQTVRRFRRRFERVALLHSGMTDAERAAAWHRIRSGEIDIVIGPRSAVFAPVPRLGLLVVDEEHEGSFKQQNTPRYHARDVGILRAKKAGAVALLGSATPALESWKNAIDGRYGLLTLANRVPGRRLPEVRIVNRGERDERDGVSRHFTRTLQVRMREALRDGGQVILLQNRRGFATSVACERCGFTLCCQHCDVAMTYHKGDRLALCHLCGHEAVVPRACPDCAVPRLEFRGTGTQTVEDELRRLFPEARVARMDSDSMARREAYEEVLGRFGRGEVDVLVGTQMIAKGLDFPRVTLVGIINADTSLGLPDFRAAERTFSLIAQVAGRAGRGDVDGRVVVQTMLPDNPAICLAAAQDYKAFAARELAERETFGYAPYRRLLRVLVRGPKPDPVARQAETTRDVMIAHAGADSAILGPSVPPIERMQGLYRRHLLLKAPDHRDIARVVEALKRAQRPRGKIEVQWDVDPTESI